MWQTIDSAPKDGTEVTTAKKADWIKAFEHFSYPITSRFKNGRWEAEFGHGWATYEPQPTHWQPLPEPPTT